MTIFSTEVWMNVQKVWDLGYWEQSLKSSAKVYRINTFKKIVFVQMSQMRGC